MYWTIIRYRVTISYIFTIYLPENMLKLRVITGEPDR